MSLIIFAHGNSFPGTTYRVLLDHLRTRGFTVKAVDKFGHDPAYPVNNNWTHLVQQLADFAQRESDAAGEKAYLVGHSLGGFLSLMAAARHPNLAQGVVLLDSPILGGWRAKTLGVIKRTDLVGSFSPGAISQKRRNSWPDTAAALAYFQTKKAFARWQPEMLQDYVQHGTHEEVDKNGTPHRVLSFQREIETAIYNSLPDNLDRLLRRHPLKCPLAFIGGVQSVEMKQVGMAMTQKLAKGRISMLEGSHLFPMEKPLATAAMVEASLRGMAA